MSRRLRTAILVAFVLVGSSSLPVLAQDEAVEIRFKLGRGETLYYTTSGSIRTSFRITGTQRADLGLTEGLALTEGRLTLRVFDVDPDGTMLVEAVVEDPRITFEGRTVQRPSGPSLFKITPDARIVEQQMGSLDFIQDISGAFPRGPVKLGDSWSRELNKTLSGVAVQLKETATLIGVERNADGLIARIRRQMEGRTTNVDFEPPAGLQAQIEGTVRGAEDLVWSIDRGRSVSDKINISVDVRIEMSRSGQTVRGDFSLVMAFQFDTLPGDKVVVPSIDTDALVVPGKAIGDFALSESLADLTRALGTPEPDSAPDATMWGADRGFRTDQVGFSNGLVVHLDATDQTTVLGFGIADSRYRTDKGVGVGSSQGAVMFAHGMSPVRVDMAGGGGAVWVLVYNDQGIAFAITADKAHAQSFGKHAPIGAVDWIVIFPPGGAAKIFPLP